MVRGLLLFLYENLKILVVKILNEKMLIKNKLVLSTFTHDAIKHFF